MQKMDLLGCLDRIKPAKLNRIGKLPNSRVQNNFPLRLSSDIQYSSRRRYRPVLIWRQCFFFF